VLWICRIIRRYIVLEGELHVESDLPYGNVGVIDSKSHYLRRNSRVLTICFSWYVVSEFRYVTWALTVLPTIYL